MNYCFEIYLLNDKVTRQQWQRLYDAICSYSGILPKFRLIVTINNNIVRYFLLSDQDFGALANNLDGLILRPVSKGECKTPASQRKRRFVQFVTGGNLLDFKEKHEVKHTEELQHAVFDMRAINKKKAVVKARLYFKDAAGIIGTASKLLTIFPSNLLAANFSGDNSRYTKKSITKYLDIEKSTSLFSSDDNAALFSVDGFPYFTQKYFIGLPHYEFDKHSFLVGATGSGKSKLISLLIDRLASSQLKNNFRVVVIDPHASLAEDLKHISSTKIINFDNDSTQLFAEESKDIQAVTELTTVLFKSLIGEQFNPRLERTLRFSLFVLFTAQNMSLDSLKRFLTDTDLRNQVLKHVTGYVPNSIVHFFGSDFNELRTQHYAEAVQPITALIEEMQLQPSIGAESDISLASVIKSNFLTVFSLNKVSMGDKVVKTVAGLIIQQIFLLAQARAFDEKIILVIDEVSVVQTPALARVLAEARKFNLSVILSQQYFGQIERDLQSAIFANVYNYYVFKVSEEDARTLEGNLSIELPKAIVASEKEKGLKESDIRVKILTELNPRECLVRLAANGQIVPCVKVRTVDAKFMATPLAQAQELVPVKPKVMPAKFVETGNLTDAQETDKANSQSGATDQDMINLSVLLSEHSSSRFKVNPRKDKK